MTFEEAVQSIARADRIVAFTGAGISTESGIPDFRSPGGVWATNRIVEYREFVASRAGRVEYWRQKVAMWPEMRDAQPNAGHRALADLERRGKLRAMITQNIDGLHQRAGNADVIELHGTTVEAECLSCGARISMDEAVAREMGLAVEACYDCEIFLAIGSSLVVHPAASLPELAKRNGAALLILNRTPTPLDDLADLVLRDEIGTALPALIGAG